MSTPFVDGDENLRHLPNVDMKLPELRRRVSLCVFAEALHELFERDHPNMMTPVRASA